MKKYLPFLSIAVIIFLSTTVDAQGVAVNATGAAADPSAMLDINSSSKGVLVPRVVSVSAVTTLANGLLVYQTNAPAGFYYYNGTAWIYLQNTGAVNGILKGNGTTVSAAVPADFPVLNQNTTGNAATVTTNANLTGAVTSTGNATTYNTVVPANKGGAGTVSGILKANGSGVVSAATAQDLSAISDVQPVDYNYTILPTDGLIYTSIANNQYTLPSAVAAGKGKTIYIRGDPAHYFTVKTNGTDLIYEWDSTTSTMPPYSRYYGMYVSDGVNKWIEVDYKL